jgi:hypothetical protein
MRGSIALRTTIATRCPLPSERYRQGRQRRWRGKQRMRRLAARAIEGLAPSLPAGLSDAGRLLKGIPIRKETV